MNPGTLPLHRRITKFLISTTIIIVLICGILTSPLAGPVTATAKSPEPANLSFKTLRITLDFTGITAAMAPFPDAILWGSPAPAFRNPGANRKRQDYQCFRDCPMHDGVIPTSFLFPPGKPPQGTTGNTSAPHSILNHSNNFWHPMCNYGFKLRGRPPGHLPNGIHTGD